MCVNTFTHTQMQAHTQIYAPLKSDVYTWLRRHFYTAIDSNSNISAMKQALRLWRSGCGRRVSTARSFLCRICFAKQAVLSGSRSSGNKHPSRPGNIGNSGNSSAKGALYNAGNRVRGKSKKIAGRAGAFKVASNKESLEQVFNKASSRSTQSILDI